MGANLATHIGTNDNTNFADGSFSLLHVKPMPHPECQHVHLTRADPHYESVIYEDQMARKSLTL